MVKNKKFLFLIVCVAILGSCKTYPIKKERALKDRYDEVVAYAKEHLAQEGVLIQKIDGYAYLKVDDNYIHELFKRLGPIHGYNKPPYFRRKDAPGAHVSVAYEDEKIKFAEVGAKYYFTITAIREIAVNKSTHYIILDIYAPQLEELRKRYGLSPKLKNHEFHITIAKKIEGKK
jgi:hypothetical protein